MMPTEPFDQFISPFSWRYGSEAMRILWSEMHKRRLWRRVWVALAESQVEAGVVTPVQAEELRRHQDTIDIPRAHAIEAEIQHDLMAELHTFAEQCGIAGGVLHLGATSMDIEDNADALRLREAVELLITRLKAALETLVEKITLWADTPCLAYTHLQPAEITTVGYRLAQVGQDLYYDLDALRHLRLMIRGKGMRGAVGTSASYQELLVDSPLTTAKLEAQVLEKLGLKAFPVVTQTYPRKQDLWVLNTLAGIASSIYKFALDLRLLQMPVIGEWAEPFGAKQVGSSAMPFKRNPIRAEKLNSLGRFVAALPHIAWDNTAHSALERTLDDSANRRTFLPEAFLAVDEMLLVSAQLFKGLQIKQEAIKKNLATYGVFSASERLLMALSRAGADRQQMHTILREHSLQAWQAIEQGYPNPLIDNLCQDPQVNLYLNAGQIRAYMSADSYVGDAPERARAMAALIVQSLNSPDEYSTHQTTQ